MAVTLTKKYVVSCDGFLRIILKYEVYLNDTFDINIRSCASYYRVLIRATEAGVMTRSSLPSASHGLFSTIPFVILGLLIRSITHLFSTMLSYLIVILARIPHEHRFVVLTKLCSQLFSLISHY